MCSEDDNESTRSPEANPCTNVSLAFRFDISYIHFVHTIYYSLALARFLSLCPAFSVYNRSRCPRRSRSSCVAFISLSIFFPLSLSLSSLFFYIFVSLCLSITLVRYPFSAGPISAIGTTASSSSSSSSSSRLGTRNNRV